MEERLTQHCLTKKDGRVAHPRYVSILGGCVARTRIIQQHGGKAKQHLALGTTS